MVAEMRNPDDLDELEHVQFSMLVMSLFRHYENLHYQFLSGSMDSDTWTGWKIRISSSINQTGPQKFWQQQKETFSPKFQRFIDDEASLLPGTPALWKDA